MFALDTWLNFILQHLGIVIAIGSLLMFEEIAVEHHSFSLVRPLLKRSTLNSFVNIGKVHTGLSVLYRHSRK